MKKILSLVLALLMVVALCACGDKAEEPAAAEAPAVEAAPAAPAAEGVTWADYQAYLIEKAGANAPDLAEFTAQVNALTSWADVDQSVSPWDQMFTTIGLSTWDEFQAGTVKEPAVGGAMGGAASGEPSGEPSGEMGGASSEPPASASVENTAHGTASADEAGYKEYLHAWLNAEYEVNTTMDETMKGEFEALIDAGDYVTFPADMLFNGMLTTGSAMTYDAFVAAGGVY